MVVEARSERQKLRVAQYEALQTVRQQKYYERKQEPNADDINNITRQWNKLYQLAQYWQMSSTQRDMMEFVITVL